MGGLPSAGGCWWLRWADRWPAWRRAVRTGPRRGWTCWPDAVPARVPAGRGPGRLRPGRRRRAIRLESRDAPCPTRGRRTGPGREPVARVPIVVGADAAGTPPGSTPPTAAAGHPPETGASPRRGGPDRRGLDAFHPGWTGTAAQAAEVAGALRAAATDPAPAAGVWRLDSAARRPRPRQRAPGSGAAGLPWSWTPTGDGLIITAVAPTGSGGIRTGDR